MNRRVAASGEGFVCFLVIAMLFVMLVPPLMVATGSRAQSDVDAEPPATTQMVTVQHDGHWWVLRRQTFAHHPDCPCRGTKAEAEEVK